ncbi:hypothetical protein Lmede01_05260 [Leuconostoc mesenteroides subsp. dextranicum]|nr:hypothetical protein LEMES_00379 [Leuconostoc mesenteroides]GEK65478.1 hypothetical protein LME04_05890 [Leuconostoc mesenteroides subsp. sake]GEL85419.1 hypothetical protein LME03_17670 [Leuconostoc mesenteroides subsp. mesenteroides]GLX32548.1 hypothetical protein Lmede01_05260 [Leuconostoc mesenteroides subsp. dextranicum]
MSVKARSNPNFCATFGAKTEKMANANKGIVVKIPRLETGTCNERAIFPNIGGIDVKGKRKTIPTTIIPGTKNLL